MKKSFIRRNMLYILMTVFAVALILNACVGQARAATANPSTASTGYEVLYIPAFDTWTTTAVGHTGLAKLKLPWAVRVLTCHATLGTVTGSAADADVRLIMGNHTTTFANLSTTGQRGENTTPFNVDDESEVTVEFDLSGAVSTLKNLFIGVVYKRL